jgi:hypothetical protein
MSTSADRINLYLQKEGIIAPTDDGVFGELADRASGSFVGMAAGVGSTLEKVGLGSGIKEYFEGVQERNQQWNAPEEQSIGGYIGGAIGSALGSTAGVLGASVIGSAVGGPGVGLAAGLTVGFAQSFGNNVQRNLDAGYSTDKAYGMAFLESGIDTAIENLPFGIVGKSGKVLVQAGRLNKITAAGKRELLNRIGKRIAEQVGASRTKSLLAAMGKSGLGEGTEEGLQFLNSYLNQKLGGDERANISLNEFVDNVAQGFIGGFFLGGIENTPMALSRIRGKANDVPVGDANIAPVDNTNIVPAEQTVEEAPLFDTLISEVGNALGINIDFMDNLPNGQELMQDKNGMFDEASGTLYLNRQTYSVNPAETFGHELKHYIDAKDPALSKAFDALLESGKNDAARQEIAEIINSFSISDQEGNQEFSADMFGKLVARPETWQKMATYLDEKTPGMGEKFLQTLRDFYGLVKNKLEELVGVNPEAEAFLNNVNELQDEAARMLAELRRRNGTASQTENVVGAKGNTNVETVPVSAINVDAKRFQFKSNTNKASGVDESNKLGGDWDPRTAGNLYLWEDKNGKLYVVNGHHRLELAQRNGVENINAIIDRESDGVTAEQARRNGVLINIRDGQGEVRDYASFVRSEKLSEDEAKAQGVTARQKGRSGFLLGKAGDTLYEAYVNEVIPESKAVIIAEVANGNEAIEYAGIKLATDRKLAGETLRQTLKLAAQNTSGKKADIEQGGLFDMVDDSVLQEWEAIGKAAAKHIKEIRTRIDAAKDAIKNPEAAKSLGVKTSKGAEKLLSQAQEELARWENYATDSELMAQLREEAGISPQEVVSETEKTTDKNGHKPTETDNDVVSAKNAQTTLDKMREAFANRAERLEKTGKGMLWTDIAREYADGKVLSKESDDLIIKEITDMCLGDYRNYEVDNILNAIINNPIHSVSSRYKAKAALKSIEKKRQGFDRAITLDYTKTVAEMIAEDEKALKMEQKHYPNFDSSQSIFKARLDYLNSLNEKEINEHDEMVLEEKATAETENATTEPTPEEKSEAAPEESVVAPEEKTTTGESSEVEKNEEAAPEEIERKRIQKIYNNLKDRSAEIGFTFDEFYEKFAPSLDSIIAKARQKFGLTIGNDIEAAWISAANNAVIKAYMTYSPDKGAKLKTYASRAVANAIIDVNRKHKAGFRKSGGTVSLDQENEQGETLYEAVGEVIDETEQEYADDDFVHLSTDPEGAIKRILSAKLNKTEKAIAKLIHKKDLPPSKVIEKLGKHYGENKDEYMTREEYDLHIASIKDKAVDAGVRWSRKRLHQQINPVVVNGFVRDEYQALLDNKEYTPETLAKWGEQAKEWIVRNGGVVKAVELFLADKAPADGHVAAIARRMLLNSDVYADAIPYKDRVKLGEQEIDFRSEWGKTGRALQLNALKLDDIANVQALLNKLQENMPEEELKKLRNDIKDRTGVDIYELPDDIVEDKSRLDAVLRAHLAHKASFKDKAYEYWINAILSGPTTHFANFFGNTVHIGYELGLKRFVEAVTNTVAGRKNGASFGEFRQMIQAFNWSNALKAAGIAFDQETLDLSNKFVENTNVAIGGKLGRAIRTPGRLLKAADALAKAIIEPMETAAYAYRIGTSRGYTGNELNSFVQEQLSNQNSQAYAWAKQRALEVTFQEEPGHFIRSLMAMREADGYVGTGLKLLLPFIKTPANILRQGIRKGPIGGLQVLKQTIDIVSGKRGFDDKYVSNVAEQIIAWTAIMSLYTLSDDDDDLPIITGTSAPYGSAEYGYKANKIPPYSIRIGRSYWSYARLEPFATGLAAIADGMQAIRDAKNGKEGTAIIKDLVRSVKQSIVDKSFLESIGEINKALENPQNISRLGTNLAASAIPNVIRQFKQSFDENVQDTKSRERGMEFLKDQFFVVTNRAGITTALPKVDYFGRDVQKDDWGDTPLSFVGRLLPVKRIAPDDNMDEVEKLIWNYNQKNPSDTYYPSIPQNRFVKNGTKMYFTGSNYREFAVAAGKLAHKQMLNAVKAGRLNIDNPDENDIKLIKKIFTRARKEVRERMSANAKKE